MQWYKTFLFKDPKSNSEQQYLRKHLGPALKINSVKYAHDIDVSVMSKDNHSSPGSEQLYTILYFS